MIILLKIIPYVKKSTEKNGRHYYRKQTAEVNSAACGIQLSQRINSGNAVSNFTPYQWAGAAQVFSMALQTKSAAIFTDSSRDFSMVFLPISRKGVLISKKGLFIANN